MGTGRSPKRLVVGISGASGAEIAFQLLKAMREHRDWETHLVVSQGATMTIAQETSYAMETLTSMATRCHAIQDLGAGIASGTFRTEGMVVVPCSMKTLAGIVHGFSQNLLLRAADVTLKERRRLVLVARESPLSSVHLQNMLAASNLGAVVLPPVMTFYNHPTTIHDMTMHVVGKILDAFGLEPRDFKRWGEPPAAPHGGRRKARPPAPSAASRRRDGAS